MKNLRQISNFKVGQLISGFFICKQKYVKTTKNGDFYLDLVLSDSTGIVMAKLWDAVELFEDRFNVGDAVAIKGRVAEFNGNLQLTIQNINKAIHGQYSCYGFSDELLIRKVEESIEDLWSRLFELIKTLSSPYKKLIKLILKRNEKKIKNIPASIDFDYALKGGYLKKIVILLEMAIDILPKFTALDRNLVISGLIIHDIGKVEIFNDELMINYSESGELLGSIGIGLNILNKTALMINDFPKNILIRLEHIIIMDVNKSDLDDLALAKFPEAVFIKSLYSLTLSMDRAISFSQNK